MVRLFFEGELSGGFPRTVFFLPCSFCQGQEGSALGAVKPCLSLVLTRAAQDGNRTHIHQVPPLCQACAKYSTHGHVVPQPSQEAAVVIPILLRRLREERVPRLRGS